MGFYNDLKFGTDSERLLFEQYPIFEYANTRCHDLKIKGTNIKIELKSDSHDMNKYGNLIMERWSKEDKPGGPWQAQKNDCRYFVYKFVQNNVIFVFNTVQLLARLKKIVKKQELKLFDRWNPGYITQYYKVPIDLLNDLNLGMERLEREYKNAAKKVKKAGKKR